MERKSKPNWWVPLSLVPLMIVAILIEGHFKYPVEIHEILVCAIVIATFALMLVWVRANAAALEEEESTKERWVFTEESNDDDETSVVELPIDSIPESRHSPMIQPTYTDAGLRSIDIDPSKGRYN